MIEGLSVLRLQCDKETFSTPRIGSMPQEGSSAPQRLHCNQCQPMPFWQSILSFIHVIIFEAVLYAHYSQCSTTMLREHDMLQTMLREHDMSRLSMSCFMKCMRLSPSGLN